MKIISVKVSKKVKPTNPYNKSIYNIPFMSFMSMCERIVKMFMVNSRVAGV